MNEKLRKKRGTEVATTRPLTIVTLPSHGSQSYTRLGKGGGPGGRNWLARTEKSLIWAYFSL